MTAVPSKTGVLLMNLGTPDAPEASAVAKYLAEFLMDPYVVDIPWLARWLLVHAIILPRRPKRSAQAYAKIWTERGSPLLFHTSDLARKVAVLLGDDFAVEFAMRYGSPSIRSGLERLRAGGCGRVVAIPLFPQYSLAATESAAVEFRRAADEVWRGVETTMVREFFEDERFLSAFASGVRSEIAAKAPDYVLFSFHGIPERHIKKTDPTDVICLADSECCAQISEKNRLCYRAQCYATARALATRLGLESSRYGVSFQSRLGRTPWIKPYTDHLYEELPRTGVKRLLVISPSFVADCLETLEEIEIRGREQFRAAGGSELWLVPSLNSSDEWARAVADFARRPPTVFTHL